MSSINRDPLNFVGAASFIRVVTPEMAREWLASNSYDRQRPLQRKHVAYLAAQMRNGLFVQNTTIRFAKVGTSTRLIDGQHRLSAVVASDKPMSFNVVIDDLSNEHDMAWTYGHIDVGKRRTNRDVYHALNLRSEMQFEKFTHRSWNSFCAAINMIKHGGRSMGASGMPNRGGIEANIDLMKAYQLHANRYFSILPASLRSMKMYEVFYAPAIAMSALVTFRFAPDRAEEFWKKVVFADHSNPSDVTSLLHTYLVSTPRYGYQNTIRIIHVIAHIWNKYCNGATLKQIKAPSDTGKEFEFKYAPAPAEWSKVDNLTPTAD